MTKSMKTNLLEVKNLGKKYGGKTVVEQISFCINEGDIIGFIGPNGAGKSTSINMITSIVDQDMGHILFRGEDVEKNKKKFKKSLGVVPQDLAIYEDLTAYDNVKFFCSLYHFKGNELKARVKETLEFV